MRISSFSDYAIVLLSAAARHCGADRVTAQLLSTETHIPLPTTQKLLSRLTAGGILHSTRGSGGGIRLARPPAAISLAEIIEAVEGPIVMTACAEHGDFDCSLEATCQVRPHWNKVNGAVRGALGNVSLANLTGAVV